MPTRRVGGGPDEGHLSPLADRASTRCGSGHVERLSTAASQGTDCRAAPKASCCEVSMPKRYSSEFRAGPQSARSGQTDRRAASTFGVSKSRIHTWRAQDRIDRERAPGVTTTESPALAAARRRIRELEAELAASRRARAAGAGPGRHSSTPTTGRRSPRGSSRTICQLGRGAMAIPD